MKHVLIILGIILFALLPAIIFHENIEFSKDKFTEEWIKIVISSLLIFYIINYIMTSQENLKRKHSILSALKMNFIEKLNFIHLSLKNLSELDSKQQIDSINNFDFEIIRTTWKIILDQSDIHVLNSSILNLFCSDIQLLFRTNRVEKLNATINQLGKLENKIYDKNELYEAIIITNYLKTSFLKMYEKTKK